jgi:two-component system CheB/CheR fusion protein
LPSFKRAPPYKGEVTVPQENAMAGPEQIPAGSDLEQAFPVVALGASAGGLESLERFFSSVPRAPGMAFVVVQHLSPDFRSMMDELLARYSTLAIRRAADGMPVAPNTIYVMPPGKDMILSHGRLHLTDRDPTQTLTLPIDHFFRSLAQDCGSRAVAIVLSGSGSDGSRGIRDVHKAGGLVVAESEHTAKFDGMPGNARRSGVVDFVLPPEDMARVLLDHIGRSAAGRAPEADEDAVIPEGLEAVFALLHREYEIDFSHYKTTTVARRIDRRLQITRAASLQDYVDGLRAHPDELHALYEDLLIGVTAFFRDPESFAHIETHIVPAIVAGKAPHEEVRIWVAGCATGEEAYSLGILFHEALTRAGRTGGVKIFATDVNARLLETASQGFYDADRLAEVSPERLERYFVRQDERYQVAPVLRQLTVFAPHNLLRDAPFTNLDFVSCRNLLIYFQPHAQQKALLLFHFGLRTGGMMFLGSSETPGDLSDEFEPLHHHIYRKRRDVRLTTDFRLPTAGVTAALRSRLKLPPSRPAPDTLLMATYDLLLDRYMPPAFLVSEHRELIDSFGGAERFLRAKARRPSHDVLDLLDPQLRMPLFGLLQRAAKGEPRVRLATLAVASSKGEEHVRLAVEAVRGPRVASTHYLITLEPAAPLESSSDGQVLEPRTLSTEQMRVLEEELHFARENLQATIEELEASNEELQATNEELVASNEELQSTNEELHSVNEELYTVNAEHQRKIQELSELNRDMKHLLEATDVATLFLDGDLRVRRFTPRVAQVFDLLDGDIGRRIASFTSKLQYPPLLDELKQVLADGQPREHEVRDERGTCYLLRLLPYHVDEAIAGVVLSLVDVTVLAKARENLSRLSAIIEHTEDAVMGTDVGGMIVSWNPAAATLFGYSAEEAIGRHGSFCVPPDRYTETAAATARALHGERIEHFETVLLRKDGVQVDVSVRVSAVRDASGRIVGISTIARDVSDRKRGERRQATEHAVAQVAAEARLWEDAVPKLLDALCQHLRVNQALMFQPDGQRRELVCNGRVGRAVDMKASMDAPAHERQSAEACHRAARQAADLQRIVWSLERRETEAGQPDVPWASTIYAVPVLDGGDCRAVLCVELRGEVTPDSLLLEMFGVISQTVGQLLLRTTAEADLRDAVSRRDHFLAMLSHELRNPLAAVRNATLALQRPDTNGVHQGATRVITRQVQHMSHLLDDLLDVTRLTQDRLTLQRGPLVVAAAVDAAVEMVEPLARERNVTMVVGDRGTDLVINGDSTRVSQMLANLLTNSVKYSPPGSEVAIHVESDGTFALIRVRDRGMGMTPAVMARAFELFYQADQTLDRSASGMGVGLTLARRLAEMHEGTIDAYSGGPGRGSEFVVRLPLDRSHELPAVAPSTPAPAMHARDVVVVEDHDDNRAMMEMLLACDGHRVHTAAGGPEGLALIERIRPDVALIDIGLPGLDGYEVARRIREDRRLDSVGLIALSGYAQPADVERAVAAGFDQHVAKPVTYERLWSVVQLVCHRRGASQRAVRRADAPLS